ncbi:peptidase M16 [Maritimibacter sp. 55A14]|nr:pitrilysin family protein [Maritimibacter sp. 55A14]PWE29392.1 peptidase M16 [Maritimibacter sp. 55A14]
MRKLLGVLAVALHAAPAAHAAENVTTFTLDNGLEAVVIEDHRAPVVVHMLWYKVGSADETAGKSGIAHYLEHLLFKGTDDMAPGEFSATVKANGGSDNAFTSYDYTGYFQRVAADRLGLMMRMEADRMRDLVLTEEDAATELNVIIEERNQRVENNPGALFSEQRMAAAYLNHPYGRPVIGWRHEMESLTREDALAFYRRYYAPNNAILVVAGDVDPAEVQALAEEHYGPLEPTPGLGPRVRPSEPPQRAERRITYADPRVAQPYVIRSYLVPERNPGDQREAAALTLLAELLGGSGLTSALGHELQIEEKLAVQTSAFYGATSYDPPGFGIYVVPAEGVTLEEAEEAMDRVLAGFLEEGVDAAQLERIKTQLRASLIYALDSLQGQARRYGEALTSGLTVADVEAWPEVLQSVTAEEIVAVGRKYLDRRRAVTGRLVDGDGTAPAPEGAAPVDPQSTEVTQ